MEMEQITFGDIKDAVVAKFCVAECAPFYQKALLGCCTASMIQDTGTKHICPILFLDEKGTVKMNQKLIFHSSFISSFYSLVNRSVNCT